MPGDQTYWEAVSTLVNTPQQNVAFSAWFGPLRLPYGNNQQIPVFKSWGSPNLQSAGCSSEFFTHTHNVLLPTATFIQLRGQLDAYQNSNGLMFAGGWTNWFDSQEAALVSAMNVAQTLQAAGKAQPVSSVPGSYDPSLIPGQVKSWIEMVMGVAPEPYRRSLAQLVNSLG